MYSLPVLVLAAFIPVILGIGLATSFEDAAKFKIRNRLVFSGIFYSLLLYTLCTLFSALGFVPALPAILREFAGCLLIDAHRWVFNALISFVVGYVLWKKNIWGGGDAKLFLCYAMLTPIGVYRYSYLGGYFASFLHLQLTFIPATLFLLGKLAFFRICRSKKITREEVAGAINKWVALNFTLRSLKGVLKTSLGFLGILLSSVVFSGPLNKFIFSLGLGQNIAIVIMLLWYKGLSRFFRKNIWFIVIMYLLLVVMAVISPGVIGKAVLLQLPRSILLMLLTGIVAPWLYRLVDVYAEETKRKHSAMAIWMFIATCLIWVW